MTPKQFLEAVTQVINSLPEESDVSTCIDGILVLHPVGPNGFGNVDIIRLEEVIKQT